MSGFLRMKIISMGDGAVGKSVLIKKYCEETFIRDYIATIGVDFGVKPIRIDGMEVKVNFWDLSGHPEFFEVRNDFYKSTQGAILVYDVTSRRSFDSLKLWLEEADKYGASNIQVAVCANKIDQGGRVVTENEGSKWAAAHNFLYFETSAKTGKNVSEMFNALFARVIRKKDG